MLPASSVITSGHCVVSLPSVTVRLRGEPRARREQDRRGHPAVDRDVEARDLARAIDGGNIDPELLGDRRTEDGAIDRAMNGEVQGPVAIGTRGWSRPRARSGSLRFLMPVVSGSPAIVQSQRSLIGARAAR